MINQLFSRHQQEHLKGLDRLSKDNINKENKITSSSFTTSDSMLETSINASEVEKFSLKLEILMNIPPLDIE